MVTFLLGILIAWVFRPFITEIAKNAATKLDARAITTEQEFAKQPFTENAEALRHANQMRMAALEKRLQAHQDAFTLWLELKSNIFTERRAECIAKCSDWWGENCLYLEGDVRKAFPEAYWAADIHPMILGDKERSEEKTRHIQANMKKIMDFGDVVMRAVALPALSGVESPDLKIPDTNPGRTESP